RGPVTLLTALTKSINVIPVRLAESFGRGKIVETAKKVGIRSELLITRSLPLGTTEVTVLDMTGAYTVFANGGRRATPYAVIDIRTSSGEVIYDHHKDGPKSEQVIPAKYIAQLNQMLTSVVEFGTGRRAQLDFTVAGGKTGTTQAYRDAWFMGFTGKYVAGVWFGNDNFTSTRRMTGGSLPAMTWKQFMVKAHRDFDIPPIIGAMDPRGVMSQQETQVASSELDANGLPIAAGPQVSTLSKPMAGALEALESLFRHSPPVEIPEEAQAPRQVSEHAPLPGRNAGIGLN
ncbi:MAG: hypothetical protein K8F25_08835, partial [Fimbriimonadaceae bacterium]|nr:hypothetical protein [Alphaproteobacteria bacterium]